MPRYREIIVPSAVGQDDWMKLRDEESGETILIGLCSRELQLRILRALNDYSGGDGDAGA